ncbi:MAG: hypothetical protein ACE5G7_02170 [Candidatus Hydrothermarchaeaceae archaeon]
MSNTEPAKENMGQRDHIVYSTLKKRYEVVIEHISATVVPPRKSQNWR